MERVCAAVFGLLFLFGCSDASEQHNQKWQVNTQNPGQKKTSFTDALKDQLASGSELLQTAQEIKEQLGETTLATVNGLSVEDKRKAIEIAKRFGVDESHVKQLASDLPKKKFVESHIIDAREGAKRGQSFFAEWLSGLGLSDQAPSSLPSQELQDILRRRRERLAGHDDKTL
ncbi:MAG: hypothetical protein HQL67_10150 [Magnetococcales bacterium]|nr:hypothetical protein [Magnetococcales bacterium]